MDFSRYFNPLDGFYYTMFFTTDDIEYKIRLGNRLVRMFEVGIAVSLFFYIFRKDDRKFWLLAMILDFILLVIFKISMLSY
jgi:hypothetical protein